MNSNDIFAALGDFHATLADAGSSGSEWRALDALAGRVVGAKLFTVMTIDLDAGLARRLYTNMPDAYPASGTKPVSVTPWFETVVLGRQTFVMNTIGEIAGHFADHELIATLGCGSCVNMPVAVGGRVLGTVNMLDAEHFFTPERLALVEHLRIPALAALLAAARNPAG
jgi:GAF domain-containing protein